MTVLAESPWWWPGGGGDFKLAWVMGDVQEMAPQTSEWNSLFSPPHSSRMQLYVLANVGSVEFGHGW